MHFVQTVCNSLILKSSQFMVQDLSLTILKDIYQNLYGSQLIVLLMK